MTEDHPSSGESDDDSSLTRLTKRQFLGALMGTGLLGGGSRVANAEKREQSPRAGDGNPSPGGGHGGGPGGDGGGAYPTRQRAVTLITGHTIVVTDEETPSRSDETGSNQGKRDDTAVERTYAVEGDLTARFRVSEEPDGTYIIPETADLDRLDRFLFNVDYLVDNGYDDASRDTIPVFARPRGTSRSLISSVTQSRTFESTGAVATTVSKPGLTGVESGLGTDGFSQIQLDRRVHATLNASAPDIKAPGGREQFSVDGEGKKIAVIDTGIDASHADFGDRVGYSEDFTGDGLADEFGHGTHVAGIAAGDGSVNDGEYVGIAPKATLMSLKALDSSGRGYLSDIVDAIETAVEEGADVINMSIGGPPQEDDPMVEAANWARDQGVTVVVSAGNESGTAEFQSVASPAVAAGAIAVGASDDEQLEHFASARGPAPHTGLIKPEVTAPGTGVTAAGSSDAGEDPYAKKSGTSMSAPHVSGLAALVLQQYDDPTPSGVENCLVATGRVDSDTDVYKRGGGVVDAVAALESPLRIHNTVLEFGTLAGGSTVAGDIEIENVSDSERTVSVVGTLFDEADDTDLSSRLSVDPESVTIGAGETQAVTVTIDVTELFGHHAGDITIQADGRTYTAIVGFTRALEVVVEKTGHGQRDSAAGDYGILWSHDGNVRLTNHAAFDTDGVWKAQLFHQPETISVWSEGFLPADTSRDQQFGEPVYTVASGIDLTDGASTVHLDETAAVPRSLDTSAIADKPTHEAFDEASFSAGLYGVQTDGGFSFSRLFFGDVGVYTAHFTPLTAGENTHAATEWQFYPSHGQSHTWDVDEAYSLFEPSETVPEGGETIAVEPGALAREDIEYHRDFSGQSLRVANHALPADRETFPTSGSIALINGIGPDRDRQTWWRTPQRAAYLESWRDSRGFFGGWVARRLREFVPPEPGEFSFLFNQQPLGQVVSDTFGTVISPLLVHQTTALADQPPGQLVFGGLSETSGGFQLRLNDSVIYEDKTAGPAPVVHVDAEEAPQLATLTTGDDFTIRHDGWDRTRKPAVGIRADYSVDYDPESANRTPLIQAGAIAGQTGSEFRSGPTIVWVKLTPAQEPDKTEYVTGNTPTEITEFVGYYTDGTVDSSGSVAQRGGSLGNPWEHGSDWTQADVVYHDETRHLIGLQVEGYDSQFHLAIGSQNESGGQIRSAVVNAAGVRSWADESVAITMESESIDCTGDDTVTVSVDPFDGAEQADWLTDGDSSTGEVQFGAPQAVFDGEAATPSDTEFRADNTIVFTFPAAETGYASEYSPVAAFLELNTPGETRYAGVTVVEEIIV